MQSKMTVTDGNICNGGKQLPTKLNRTPVRRGKWTPEEESYALAVIRDFNNGCLDCTAGTSLRTYLSEKLNCDPMRITKKFTGDASIGKKVFHPAARDDPIILTKCQTKIEHLYQQWKRRLESQEQEMARKSMADAAVSVASTFQLFSTASASSQFLLGVPAITTSMVSTNDANIQSNKAQRNMIQTATWLDRADKILLPKKAEIDQFQRQKEIEDEMKEISRLISESPEILAISADLPKLLDKT